MRHRFGFREAPRGASSLRRPPPAWDPQAIVLIVCEGNKTEPLYFNALRRYRRLSATKIEIVPGGISGSDPRSIVRYARQRKKWMKRRGLRFDQVWCVFDRDDHPKIEQAFLWADQSHFSLAYSNPCFELWFILHFQDVDHPLDRYEALNRLRRLMPEYRKTSSVFHLLLPRQAEAIRRAQSLRNRGRGTRFGSLVRVSENPSTSVDELVLFLNRLAGRPRHSDHARHPDRNPPGNPTDASQSAPAPDPPAAPRSNSHTDRSPR